jgi:hypothetical protein
MTFSPELLAVYTGPTHAELADYQELMRRV